jgi:predicted transposase YdaD
MMADVNELPGRNGPGPIYDSVMRELIEADLSAACRFLGIPITTASEVPTVLPGSIPHAGRTGHADLLMRVGPDRLSHLEYQLKASSHLVLRMRKYCGEIMQKYPGDELAQHILILKNGQIAEPAEEWLQLFWKAVTVLYLRDVDPAVFLKEVSLAPLASLGRGGAAERAEAFRSALLLIGEQEDKTRVKSLLEHAVVLAKINLKPGVVERIVKEVFVSQAIEDMAGEVFRRAGWGESLRQEGLREGRQEGRQEGREDGLRSGRAQSLELVLRERFGDPPGILAVVQRLAGWSDPAAAMHAAFIATDLEALGRMMEVAEPG